MTEALSEDVGRAVARIDPDDLQRLEVTVNDLVEVTGKRRTVCKPLPLYRELRGQSSWTFFPEKTPPNQRLVLGFAPRANTRARSKIWRNIFSVSLPVCVFWLEG